MNEHTKPGALTSFAGYRDSKAGHPDIPGYKWEMNYRGYNVYYSAKEDRTIAVSGSELIPTLKVTGSDGSIFGEIDKTIEP